MEKINVTERSDASLIRGASSDEECHIHGIFEFECYDAEGNLRWKDTGKNIVTNQGKNNMMDTLFGATTSIGTPALPANWWMSLITTGGATATSTYATPSPAVEITSATVATRPTVTWTASSAGVKTATTTSFVIIGSSTIVGNMLVTATSSGATVGNTAGAGGVLFSSSLFTGGSKTVSSGDTLNCSYSLTI